MLLPSGWRGELDARFAADPRLEDSTRALALTRAHLQELQTG
jgi:hypothetical protein